MFMSVSYSFLNRLKPKATGAFLILALSATAAQAQVITSNIVWNFTTATPSSVTPANANVTASAFTQGNNNGTTTLLTTTSASSGYAGASGSNNAGAAARTGPLSTAAAGSAYFEVTFTPVGGIIINSITFGNRSTGTGPQAYSIRTSIDAFASNIASGTIANNSNWTLLSNTFTNVTADAPVTLRIYGHNGTGSPATGTANWRIDDVTINVSASDVPLPVAFTAFTANRKQQSVLLQWSTGMEKDVSHFELEHSDDGEHFSYLARVAARNQATGADYQYSDKAASASVYYRLKTVDMDGRYAYSSIAAIQGDAGTLVTKLEANPVHNILPVSFAGKSVAVEVYVVNLAGIVLQHQAVTNVSRVNMDVAGLTPGIYLLQVKGSNVAETFKFVKQ